MRPGRAWNAPVRVLLIAGALLLLPGPVRAQAEFDHETSFSRLPADNFSSRQDLYYRSTRWYLDNYDFAKYSGYQDLLKKFKRYLPTGRGLTVLQAESSHTPDAIGEVTHLFDYEASDTHSENVAEILSEASTRRDLYTRYHTFSVDLDSFHTADIGDLLGFFPHMNSTDGYYPATDYDNMPITPAKLLNVSNSAGVNSSSRVRQLDKFIEENDLVACTAQSGTEIGNRTTSGNAYNSIVVDQYYGDVENFDGATLNDHGAPRYKPDLMARSGSSAATSFSTPTVCSAAAVLLERASVDAAVANASHSVVVKAMLMAGATRFNYRLSVEWSDTQEIADPPILRAQPLFYHGEWQRPSDALPTSPRYGAGHLNILAAYDILDAGEFDAGGTEALNSRGWDYADELAEAEVNTYHIAIAEDSMFSAVLVWHRYIDDDFVSYLPDYAVSVYDSDETRVAHSDSLTSNIELVEVKLPAGTYRLEVTVKSDGDSPDALSYGLAWITKEIAPQPQTLTIENLADGWELGWDLDGAEADYKYRVQVSPDADFSTLEKEVYLDGATYTYPPPGDDLTRYFRVSTYPQDGDVAYFYPSSPRSTQSTAAPNTPATGQPTIGGPTVVGETLTAGTTAITDANGLGAFRYQWRAHTGTTTTALTGATAATYTLGPADEGKTITVQVTFTDGDGYEETLISPATAQVTAFSLTVSGATLSEASGRATVTVSTGGATFTTDQTITLSLSGTAMQGTDYTVGSETLTLTAGQSMVATAITAVDDHVVEGGETIVVTARHRGRPVGTPVTLTLVDDDQPPPPPPPPPGNTGGGSGGGGGGGSQDQHGNTPGQATVVSLGTAAPWATATSGQINTTRDVDYFTLTAPHAGVVVVETTGSTDTVGTVWQAGVELGQAASGGVNQNFHLSVPVEAGEVVIAVAGTGSTTGAYTLQTHLVVGYLENPGDSSSQSGIGVLSGWVCGAEVVTLELNGVVYVAAYGTERLDTLEVCGDSDNGFGLLFNWNLLGDGEHEVIALVDGSELTRTTVTVTTLGVEFLRGVTGECTVPDFPSLGEAVRLVWQEAQQNFVLAEGSAPTAPSQAGAAGVGYLENPSPHSYQSGIGVISGWVCEVEAVVITLGDLAPQAAGYGTERLDTQGVCGDTDNGFGLLFNWNLLGDGEHTVIATVDGIELARTPVRVTTLGEEFVRGAVGECVVEDFPHLGQSVRLEWQQNQQNFVITDIQ